MFVVDVYETAVALEKACHEHMKKTVPRYNAERWAVVEKNTKNNTAAFYTDERVTDTLPKEVVDAQMPKLVDADFPTVAAELARNPFPVVPSLPPVNDPVKPGEEKHPPRIEPGEIVSEPKDDLDPIVTVEVAKPDEGTKLRVN